MRYLAAIIFALVLASCGPRASEKPADSADMAEPGLGNWTEEFGFGGP